MTPKILFVDDEPAVLDGYRRMLHREFSVEIAVGGALGLAMIEEQGPYAIVVSDMRMPGMDGSQFLSRVRTQSPDSIRMLLTGYSDATSAINAVNHGHILRFLTKPCPKEELISSLGLGMAQYKRAIAEKEILEQTLMGTIKVLTEVLGAVSPEAFGRSARISRCVRHLLQRQAIASSWQVEVAAMVSQLGCLSLDQEMIRKSYAGIVLTVADQSCFESHPGVAGDLLLNIPRLESVAWMVRQQLAKDSAPLPPGLSVAEVQDLELAGAILRLAVEFETMRWRGQSAEEVLRRLRWRGEFPGSLVDCLEHLAPEQHKMEIKKLAVSKLAVGMSLQQDIRNAHGVLMISKDEPITKALLLKLHSYAAMGVIERELTVWTPVSLFNAA